MSLYFAANDLWSEIIAQEENQHSNYDTEQSKQQQQPEIAVIYRRKNAVNKQNNDLLIISREKACVGNENRVSWAQAPVKRVSWNRALSTRFCPFFVSFPVLLFKVCLIELCFIIILLWMCLIYSTTSIYGFFFNRF